MKENIANKYFIQEHLQTAEVYHGGVGSKDIERILLRNGFHHIQLPYHFDFSLRAKFFRSVFVIKTLLLLPSKTVIVFQWPLYSALTKVLVRLILNFRKDVQAICILTDIDGLKDGDKKLLASEMSFFKKIHFFIAHNDSMRRWLLSYHNKANISLLVFFDFLTKPVLKTLTKTCSVAFAGFLDKSSFINHLKKVKDINFHLYGSISSSFTKADHVYYYGVLPPAELIKNLIGSFGLVWDGDSILGLSGAYGEYNKFISPHKLSLYVVAGLPVIAHSSSATAAIIKKYEIGFAVNSLLEIREKIDQLSEAEYQKMRMNCESYAQQIISGHCLTKALVTLGAC